MNNPFKKQYRIVEKYNHSGQTKFYPEYTTFGFWNGFSGYADNINFDSYTEANEWLCEHINRTRKLGLEKKIHQVDEVFNNLSKK